MSFCLVGSEMCIRDSSLSLCLLPFSPSAFVTIYFTNNGKKQHQSSPVQFSPLAEWVVGGDMRDHSADILSRPFCKRPLSAVQTWAEMSTLRSCPSSFPSADHEVVHPPRCPDGLMVLDRLSWRVTWPNHARFRLLTVARRSSCGPARKSILLRTQSSPKHIQLNFRLAV